MYKAPLQNYEGPFYIVLRLTKKLRGPFLFQERSPYERRYFYAITDEITESQNGPADFGPSRRHNGLCKRDVLFHNSQFEYSKLECLNPQDIF